MSQISFIMLEFFSQCALKMQHEAENLNAGVKSTHTQALFSLKEIRCFLIREDKQVSQTSGCLQNEKILNTLITIHLVGKSTVEYWSPKNKGFYHCQDTNGGSSIPEFFPGFLRVYSNSSTFPGYP